MKQGKKSNRQKIGDDLFLYQVYTCESGCWNREMSTRSLCSIQFFTRVCDFLFVTFWLPFLSLFKSSIKLTPHPHPHSLSLVFWLCKSTNFRAFVRANRDGSVYPMSPFYPINVNIKYYISTIWVSYIFMEINWNTSMDQNAGFTWIVSTVGHKNIARPLIFPITFWAKGRVTFLQ